MPDRFHSHRGPPLPAYGASFPPAASTLPTPRSPAHTPRPARQNVPLRSTKKTEKLVLFPDDLAARRPPAPPLPAAAAAAASWPPPDAHFASDVAREMGFAGPALPPVAAPAPAVASSAAERQSKLERSGLPRVTTYCVANALKVADVARFVRDNHSVVPRTYDECVAFYYEADMKAAVFPPPARLPREPRPPRSIPVHGHSDPLLFSSAEPDGPPRRLKPALKKPSLASVVRDADAESAPLLGPGPDLADAAADAAATAARARALAAAAELGNPTAMDAELDASLVPAFPWMGRSEVFLFDFGVVVLWNFTELEEQRFLGMLSPFLVGPLPAQDIEVEDFHFQYDMDGSHQQRIFNDMITLKSANILVKLTISHGLAQSAKLALFENVMEETIAGATPLPRMMAKFGTVKMSRTEIMKIIGRLFKLKMDVNLISNVLDTPEIFWVEPELEGLYNAVRGYLEISQRAKLLNSRADVLSDLLDMLSDHLNSNEMTFITWIVIILICFAVVIAIAEVGVKFIKVGAGIDD